MRKNWTKLASIPVLLMGLWVAACSDAGSGPEPLLGPQAEQANRAGGDSDALNQVAGSIPTFTVSETIGPEGDVIGVPGFTLTVPKGAVAEPTVFTFASVNNGYVQVRATATSVGSETLNDVGSAGFQVPVLIKLSYDSNAGGVHKWKNLVLAWVRPDGQLEAVPTRLNVVAKTVTGKVGHFSDYALASGRILEQF